ncbi:flagellar cap protein FliD N-terminal domain-containing protein [Kineococcus sp. G2]|uniref:flagellar cap protein FliD N-terminal domain-containing protein n=1 Tax=Kineococcus sp. G2 TaxID=3127484 RepID=UPI00301D9F74
MDAVEGPRGGLVSAYVTAPAAAFDAAATARRNGQPPAGGQEADDARAINLKLASLRTAADALTAAASWAPVTAAASSPSVVAVAHPAAVAGAVDVTVSRLASAKSVVSTQEATLSQRLEEATLGFPLDVIRDGQKIGSLRPGSGTMNEIAAALRKASDLGVTAVAISIGDGKYRLQLTATKSGQDGSFELAQPTDPPRPRGPLAAGDVPVSAEGAAFEAVAPGADAQLRTSDGRTLASSTNTFPDVLPGVTVTATQAGPDPVTVTAKPDTSRVVAGLRAVVEATNAALDQIGRGSGTSDAATGLAAALTAPVAASAVARVGLRVDEGRLAFDETAFRAAHQSDPVAVRAVVAPTSTAGALVDGTAQDAQAGVVERLIDVTGRAALSAAEPLAEVRTAYQRQQPQLESALASLQQQSAWLQGRLAQV